MDSTRSGNSFVIAGRLIAENYDDDEQLTMCYFAHTWLLWVNALPTTYERGTIR